MAVDDVPEAVRLGMVGCAFIHHDRGAVREGAVNHVAVAGDPADVGGAKIDVGLLEVEDVFRRDRGAQQVAGRRVQHALRFAGGAAGVEDKERVFAVEALRLVRARRTGNKVVIPAIAALDHRHRRAGALQHDHMLHARRAGEGAVHVGLELDGLAPAPAGIRGDDELRLAVVHAVLDGLGAEAAKNHSVNHAQPRAGQHGHGRLGHHRHVDRRAVTLGQPERCQRVGKLADLAVQLLVGDGADVARFAFKNNRRLVFPRGAQVPVETIFGHV